MKDIGRYIIKHQLGEGGMAKVFLAEDPVLNRRVAVKWIHPDLKTDKSLLARFAQEVRTAAVLKSSHIVEIYDYGVVDKRQYFIMEYLDGYSLEYVLQDFKRRGSRMSPEIAAVITYQAALGLVVAEKHKVVHRDLKPDNLMIDSNGVVKIMDFGVALIEDKDNQFGKIFGTPMFMAPEQFDGLPVTTQTDIWSLGVNLYYLLTGTLPFEGETLQEVLKSVCTTPHSPVIERAPKVDSRLAGLVDTLLQKNQQDRGDGAQWLCDWFEKYLTGKHIYNLEKMTLKLLNAVKPKSEADRIYKPVIINTPTQSFKSMFVEKRRPFGFSAILNFFRKIFPGMAIALKKTTYNKSLGKFRMSSTVSKLFIPHAISIHPKKLKVRKGESSEIRFHLPGSLRFGKLTWTSSDPSIAVVNKASVFGIKPGKVKIILNYEGETPGRAVCDVTVLPVAVTHVVMYPAKISLKVGRATQLSPRVEPRESNSKLLWRVDNPGIVSASGGRVRALKPGYARVTAVSADNSAKQAVCEIHVKT